MYIFNRRDKIYMQQLQQINNTNDELDFMCIFDIIRYNYILSLKYIVLNTTWIKKDDYGLIIYAIRTGKYDIVRFLINFSNIKMIYKGKNYITYEAIIKNNAKIFALFINDRRIKHIMNKDTLLYLSIYYECDNITRYLLNSFTYKLDLNENSPIIAAVDKNRCDIVYMFLSLGADPKVYDNYCIKKAAILSNYAMVKLLLEFGANPSKVNLVKNSYMSDDIRMLIMEKITTTNTKNTPLF